MDAKRRMTFRRYGRGRHLLIDSPEDLRAAGDLDEGRWVATSAPLGSINCDETFLKLLDADGNGRVTAGEVKSAIGWVLGVLSDHFPINERSDTLRLTAIDTETQKGREIHQIARKILTRTARGESDALTLGEVRSVKAEVAGSPVSEAGVVLPEAARDEEIKRFIADLVTAMGGTEHPAGKRGIALADLERFIEDAEAILQWDQAGKLPPGADKTETLPFGDKTPEAWSALSAVRGKIDQYFAQCEAAALDERFVQRMGWTESELGEVDFDDPRAIEHVLKTAPLAKARADRVLELDAPVNPYYAKALEEFRQKVLTGVLGEGLSVLNSAQWSEVKSAFAGHENWVKSRPDTPVWKLGEETLRTYLDERYAREVRNLIAQGSRGDLELKDIADVEKLVLFQMYLLDFANNFISFPHLYDPSRRAMFEMGTLVMDGRRFNLAVKVDGRPAHIEMSRTSNMYVMYVEINGPDQENRYEVAIPVTSGDKGNLCVGKRGVFYDVNGGECDARIVEIIENPISIREAMISPFKRLGRALTGKIESITAGAEKKLDASAAEAVSRAAPAQSGQPARGVGGLAAGGMLMGAGVALAALGSAVAYVAKTLADAGWFPIIIAVLGAIAMVALPASIVAFLKLRRRDLSALLEGSGWAINARMRLTRAQRRSFTQHPPYPPGARGVYRPMRFVVALVILILLAGGGTYLIRRYLRAPHKVPRERGTTRPVASSQPATQHLDIP